MKNIRHLLEKYQQGILFSLIIAVIGLYLIYISENIFSKPNELLISLAAIFSSIFLFLAFKETQRSNRIVICQKIYDEFWNRIKDIEVRMNLIVFDAKEQQQMAHIRIDRVFSYNDFSDHSLKILQSINDRLVHYNVFSERFNGLLDENPGQLTNIKNLIDEIEIVNFKFCLYSGKILSLREIYKDINTSMLEKEFKEILLRKLQPISKDFIDFGQKISDKKNSELIFLKVPKLISDNNIWTAEPKDFFGFEFFLSALKTLIA